MRLALLGCDESWQAFLRDLPPDHQVVAAYEAPEELLPLSALLPNVERSPQWEALLIRDDIDLILVASPDRLPAALEGFDPQARRVDQLKKLAQAGRSLLISFPAAELLDAYEIEMLRREGNGCILPWFPGLYHSAWEELPRLPTLEITWERRVSNLTRNQVLCELARDLILISRVAGKIKRVTALASASENDVAQKWQKLSVRLETDFFGSVVRWSVARPTVPYSCRVHDEDSANPWELQVPLDVSQPWLLREHDTSTPADKDTSQWREATATFARFEELRNNPEQKADAWLEACRSLEVLAAVEKSLQRARTIEISQAEETEAFNFKGVMASGGCLLLMFSLFALFIVVLVEGLRLPLRNMSIWRLWPLGLILPMAAFLALQFLQTIIQKPRPR